jgi:transcriptional regulator with PAS, ATPase and Fis domain
MATHKTIDPYTQETIKHILNKHNQHERLVATKLGVGKSTIYRMLQKKELE